MHLLQRKPLPMHNDALSAPPGIDVTQPSVARVYDYYLGGKDNFASDRKLAEQVMQHMPQVPRIVRENRSFLCRVVQCDIRQFIDLGTGLPTQENVHEAAQAICPAARVVYVDNDPLVLAHANALLVTNGNTKVVQADIREPGVVLELAAGSGMINFSEPVALLMIAVLHFVTDDEDPWGVAREFMQAMASGSYLALSHAEKRPHAEEAAAAKLYDHASAPMMPRSRHAVERFFAGFELVAPGIVTVSEWRPFLASVSVSDVPVVGGIGRKV
jgi:hypothetical protein